MITNVSGQGKGVWVRVWVRVRERDKVRVRVGGRQGKVLVWVRFGCQGEG